MDPKTISQRLERDRRAQRLFLTITQGTCADLCIYLGGQPLPRWMTKSFTEFMKEYYRAAAARRRKVERGHAMRVACLKRRKAAMRK